MYLNVMLNVTYCRHRSAHSIRPKKRSAFGFEVQNSCCIKKWGANRLDECDVYWNACIVKSDLFSFFPLSFYLWQYKTLSISQHVAAICQGNEAWNELQHVGGGRLDYVTHWRPKRLDSLPARHGTTVTASSVCCLFGWNAGGVCLKHTDGFYLD